MGAVKSKILQADFRVLSENSSIYNIDILQERKKWHEEWMKIMK